MLDYPMAEQGKKIIPATIRERLEYKLRISKREVLECEEALSLLDQNPGFEKVHNAISIISY